MSCVVVQTGWKGNNTIKKIITLPENYTANYLIQQITQVLADVSLTWENTEVQYDLTKALKTFAKMVRHCGKTCIQEYYPQNLVDEHYGGEYLFPMSFVLTFVGKDHVVHS